MADKLIIANTAMEAVHVKASDNIYIAGGTEVMRLGSEVAADSYVSVRKTPDMRSVCTNGDTLVIGASCTFQELIDNDLVPGYLKDALHFMASRTRRNMATIGGNIAICRDDSFLIPTLLAASAVLEVMDMGGELSHIPLEDYVTGGFELCGRLITSVTVPSGLQSIVSRRNSNTAQSHARLTMSLACIDDKYRAFAAVKQCGIVRLGFLEDSLNTGSEISEDEIVELVKANSGIEIEDDLLYGSYAYRIYLLGINFALMYDELKSKGGRA